MPDDLFARIEAETALDRFLADYINEDGAIECDAHVIAKVAIDAYLEAWKQAAVEESALRSEVRRYEADLRELADT